MNRELKKAILDWLYEHPDAWQRTNACREAFRPYLYDYNGNWLIGAEEIDEFISKAAKLI